jgi:hypothetical protein
VSNDGDVATFLLVGDIRHPGTVEVEAASLEAALAKADAGDFVVHDEQGKPLAFDWNGDDGMVEVDGEPYCEGST